MVSLSIGTTVAAASLFLFVYLYRGLYEASAKIQAQQKADTLVQKITRGPMGTFGGIHSVYYNASGYPGSPNPTVTTISTNPTNQTFSFYVQTNFSGFTYVSMANYQNTSVAALYKIGYNPASKTIYYTVNGGTQVPMVNDFPANLSIGRFMFAISGTNLVNMQFDFLIQKPNGSVLTNTYDATAFYRNNPQQ